MSAWTTEEIRGALAAARRQRTHLTRALVSRNHSAAQLERLRATVNEQITELRQLLMAERELEGGTRCSPLTPTAWA